MDCRALNREAELRDLEPIFHRSPPGTTRTEFVAMVAADYWRLRARSNA